jgi:triosephosphate isomerase
MLKNSGMKYVIVGHSERRASGDNEIVVKKKLEDVLDSGMKAILCIGEKNRDEHGVQYNEVKEQIESAVLKMPKKLISKMIINYC